MSDWRCPPECDHHPDDDPIHCPASRRVERCPAHGAYVGDQCPTCAGYIAAGL